MPTIKTGDRVTVRNKGPGTVLDVRTSEEPAPTFVAVRIDGQLPNSALWEAEAECTLIAPEPAPEPAPAPPISPSP